MRDERFVTHPVKASMPRQPYMIEGAEVNFFVVVVEVRVITHGGRHSQLLRLHPYAPTANFAC